MKQDSAQTNELLALQVLSLLPSYMAPSAWWQHVPIAHWLIARLQPGAVVELGTHFGVSFFAFCDAAEIFSPPTFIYAVDTWQGDDHAGDYSEDVYQQVASHQLRHYAHRSRLVRTTFEEAAGHFSPESIDILHIDGFHTYEAVKDDYTTWYPQIKPGGSILFHDINVREGSFGVWRFWEELKKLPGISTVEVPNGHGLGIATLSHTPPPWHHEFRILMPTLVAKGVLLDQLAMRSQAEQNHQNGEVVLASRLKMVESVRDQALAEKQAALEEASRARDEAMALGQAVRDLTQSGSWRLMAPYRALADGLRRLIQQ